MNQNTIKTQNAITKVMIDFVRKMTFGPFNRKGGTFEIEIHRAEPDENGERKIFSTINFYGAEGNYEGTCSIPAEDCPECIETARDFWSIGSAPSIPLQ